ncbi:MAG: pseudouridine synthase [Bacteroidales bacterium]
MLHLFSEPVSAHILPARFTYPFHYTPHPLCIRAAEKVQAYLHTQTQWHKELMNGKMFGVLIVQSQTGEIGYLAAFSGNLAHQNNHPFFVPPVFDLLQPDGFFRIEEENISAINRKIGEIEKSQEYVNLKKLLSEESARAKQVLSDMKTRLKQSREIREARRQSNPDEEELAQMVKESQYQKAELKRQERYWQQQIAGIQTDISTFETEISQLKKERKNRSATLQQQLFDQFRLLNGYGETRGLCSIFEQTAQKTPPAGAGECAGPKLLQYAYLNQLKPIAMAEFWWGNSPKTEIRHHGQYYPACKGKCEPILNHMLQGLSVEDNPLLNEKSSTAQLDILFEDEWLLVIHKPEGMLSVPGKCNQVSVYDLLVKQYPDATGPIIVHRLDMATSGLLIIAKTKEVHKHLQAQFKEHTVKKRYIAILDAPVAEPEGTINLPLCLNPLDRPRQIVSEEYGKTAITTYKVLERSADKTRIAFYPQTGRTHQLRVHAAHPAGLNAPIIGDELYGRKDKRLFLHAESIEFTHPVTGKRIQTERKADF